MAQSEEKTTLHRIARVVRGSIAEEMGVEPGDFLVSVNGEAVEDIFDYRYQIQDELVTLVIRKGPGNVGQTPAAAGREEVAGPAGEEEYSEEDIDEEEGFDEEEDFDEDEDSDEDEWELEIEKEYGEDLGIDFESGLMDDYRSCCNHCVFCFIDQMPPGMRETLYFKDDDARLSFLQGNYITLTNMSDHDIDRIIRYRLEPINISFHTMNPELRCRMLRNAKAGAIFDKVRRLKEAGIEMNGQIVLCRGLNDGNELEYSLRMFEQYLPELKSVSVVPVGLTRFRDHLPRLKGFDAASAAQVIDQIERWQRHFLEIAGTHLVHASDEWYLLAGRDLPPADSYDGYLQLENGVGMLRLLEEEVHEALAREREEAGMGAGMSADAANIEAGTGMGAGAAADAAQTAFTADTAAAQAISEQGAASAAPAAAHRRVTIATGALAAPFLEALCRDTEAVCPWVNGRVVRVINHFFGEQITVSGLLTGQDLQQQLAGRDLGDELLLPVNMLRSGENVFLDDVTVPELAQTLQIPIRIVESSGQDLVDALLGRGGGRTFACS